MDFDWPPDTIVPGGLMLMFFFFFRHKISELTQLIAVKLCQAIGSWLNFIVQVPKFGGHTPKNFGIQKRAKFGVISDNFRL